jgi:hypothetical protein
MLLAPATLTSLGAVGDAMVVFIFCVLSILIVLVFLRRRFFERRSDNDTFVEIEKVGTIRQATYKSV